MLIGYERVSTDDQNLALQHDALQAADCEKIFSDKMSGANADRPSLKEAFEFARKGAKYRTKNSEFGHTPDEYPS